MGVNQVKCLSMSTAFTPEERLQVERKIKSAFTPHSPVNQRAFFSGRILQLRAVADTVTTTGLHAILYGERGVGKTSLTNIIQEILQVVRGVSRVNCAQGDTFDAVIRRTLMSIQWSSEVPQIGFLSRPGEKLHTLSELIPELGAAGSTLSPDLVAGLLTSLPPYVVLVIDEFDRLPKSEAAAFADLIKALSDRAAPTTLLLVGVAEDINELVATHASVERCLRQIQLPRMSDDELGGIVDIALQATGFTLSSPAVRRRIVAASMGFPHFTHALGQNSARAALDASRMEITQEDLLSGMNTLVSFGDQTHRETYHRAVTGTKKGNIWREVVAACAYAASDERGFFSSRSVQEALSRLLKRRVIQQTVAFHLGKLTEPSRGPLLQRIGPERRYRYRFLNPIMRPFVLIKATSDGLLPEILTENG